MIAHIIIAILLIIITIMIRKDTSVIKYERTDFEERVAKKIYNKYDIDKLPVYEYLIIIGASCIPIFNIIAFCMFIVVYITSINTEADYSQTYELRGNNFITKFILWFNKILHYKI